jgi:hypothetical protein
MKENQYEITFRDEQTHQEYQVNVKVNGELTGATAQRNSLWLVGGGPIRDITVNKLEDKVIKVPVEMKFKK